MVTRAMALAWPASNPFLQPLQPSSRALHGPYSGFNSVPLKFTSAQNLRMRLLWK